MSRDEERAREIVGELEHYVAMSAGNAAALSSVIAQALARARREENEACLALVTAERAKLQGRWSLDSAYLSQAETALRARQPKET